MALEHLPKGMTQTQAPVLIHRRVAPDHYWMQLKAPKVAQRAKAGQFVHVLCDGKGQGESALLLRRPFSLLDADPKRGTVDFIYKVVGLGTEVLAGIKTGA